MGRVEARRLVNDGHKAGGNDGAGARCRLEEVADGLQGAQLFQASVDLGESRLKLLEQLGSRKVFGV